MDEPIKPAISVVIPLYNKEREIDRAIRSVLAQSFQDFEIVVVNDGSTDDGPAIVETIEDPRVRLLHQNNAGVSVARNRGIDEARSELIAFLDADDEWMPEFLSTIQRLRRQFPQCDVFATNYVFRYDNGRERRPIIRGLPSEDWEGVLENYFEVASRSDPPLWTSAVAVKKQAIMQVGGFPVGITSGEDLLTWARLAVSCKIVLTLEVMAIFNLPSYGKRGELHRLPETDDSVGVALHALLLRHCSNIPGARHYLSLWHKMRASCLLRSEQRLLAVRHCLVGLYLKPMAWKLYVYLLLAPLPSQTRRHLFNRLIRGSG